MSELLAFDLVTPEKLLFSGEATLVTAPGAIGEFGVMAGHAPFVSSLKPGVLRVEQPGNAISRYFVAGGVAEVNEKGFTVLADESINLSDINQEQAQQRLKDAKAQLSVADTDQQKAVANHSVEIAEALIDALAA